MIDLLVFLATIGSLVYPLVYIVSIIMYFQLNKRLGFLLAPVFYLIFLAVMFFFWHLNEKGG